MHMSCRGVWQTGGKGMTLDFRCEDAKQSQMAAWISSRTYFHEAFTKPLPLPLRLCPERHSSTLLSPNSISGHFCLPEIIYRGISGYMGGVSSSLIWICGGCVVDMLRFLFGSVVARGPRCCFDLWWSAGRLTFRFRCVRWYLDL